MFEFGDRPMSACATSLCTNELAHKFLKGWYKPVAKLEQGHLLHLICRNILGTLEQSGIHVSSIKNGLEQT